MKTKIFFTSVLFALTIFCYGQQSKTWDKWTWLIGQWEGIGSGQPGHGGGTFSFAFDLNKKIMVRKSHSEYPAVGNRPQIIHEDLMIIYMDESGSPNRSIYFDNEGHIISYSIICREKSIEMTSEKVPNTPFFRLTYSLLDHDSVFTKFEMSADGEKYKTYIEGKSVKIK